MTTTPEEQKEHMRGFLAALRSGDYKQGRGTLTLPATTDPSGKQRHCCLGVATVHAIKCGLPIVATTHSSDYGPVIDYEETENRQRSRHYLLPRIQEFYGFSAANPFLAIPPALHTHLVTEGAIGRGQSRLQASTLNDDLNLNFEQIADCFEYTYLREDYEARHGTA